MSKTYETIHAHDEEEGSYLPPPPDSSDNNSQGSDNQPSPLEIGTETNQPRTRKNYIRMATSTLHENYKDAKKNSVDLAKEIHVECFEQWEVYESIQFIKENWYKFIFIPYLPAFHHPGWLLRYAVGPYTGELFLMFFQDFIAGITVALTLIPQALSYAQLANLPPINGLYTAVLTAASYAFFGSSMQLCVGPVALVSLLTAELINNYNIDYTNNPDQAVEFAGEVALAVGVVLVVLSLLNLGNLIRFLSHPVLSGFTTGAAALIGLNQLKSAFGFTQSVPQQGQPGYDYNYQVFQWLIDNWNNHYHFTDAEIQKKPSLGLQNGRSWRNPLAAEICFGLYVPLICIVILKNYIKATPERKKTLWFNVWTVVASLMPFVGIIIGAHVAWQIKHDDGYNNPHISHDWYAKKLSIVGKVTPGLNFIKAPTFHWNFAKLMGDVIPIAIIAYMESYGVAQRIAHQNNEFHLLNASQELWAIGVSNFLASVSSSYPVAGSFSRSSLNQVSGARTPFSKIVNMIVVVLSLQYLTKTFQYIPNAALAAIIWVAIFNLVNITDFWNAWKHSKKDFFVMLMTVTFVFVLNTGVGLAIGVGSSVFVYLFDSTFNPENSPEIVEKEEYQKSGEIRHVRLRQDINFLTSGRLLDVLTTLTLIEPKKPDILDSTWNDRVFFNVSSFFDRWLKPNEISSVTKLPKAIILDLEVVRIMDYTALHDIEEQAKVARRKKVLFMVINASPTLTKSLVKFGFHNDDLTGSVDYLVAKRYNHLAGDDIPREIPKFIINESMASLDEISNSREDDQAEVQLIRRSSNASAHGSERKDV